MVNLEKKLVEQIEHLLAAKRLTEPWLSEKTGIAYMTLRRRMNNPEKFTLRELFTISEVLGVKFIAGLTSAHTDSENTLTMVLRYIQAVELHPKVGPLTDRQLVEKQELAHWQRKLAEEINSQDTQ